MTLSEWEKKRLEYLKTTTELPVLFNIGDQELLKKLELTEQVSNGAEIWSYGKKYYANCSDLGPGTDETN